MARAQNSSRPRRRARRRPTRGVRGQGDEHHEQAKFFEAIRSSGIPAAKLTFAIPNGFLRTSAMRLRAWKEGMLAGVFDVTCQVPRPPYPSLWIEFKVGDNDLSPEQVAFGEAMHALGHKMVVAYSAEEALSAWCDYLGLSYATRPQAPRITLGKTASHDKDPPR